MTNLQVSNRKKQTNKELARTSRTQLKILEKNRLELSARWPKKNLSKVSKKTAKILRNSGLNNLMTASQKCKHRVQGSFKGFSQRTDI